MMPNTGFCKPLTRVVAICVVSFTLLACAHVEPWQRGRLARADMAWDPDPLLALHRNHAYFSKEAANGGVKAAGGGCGCN